MFYKSLPKLQLIFIQLVPSFLVFVSNKTELEKYSGAEEHIRQAISNSSNEALQEAAWQAVCPLVQKLKSFHMFSGEVGTCLWDVGQWRLCLC